MTDAPVFDTGVPVPPRGYGGRWARGTSKYHLHLMQPGQSQFIAATARKAASIASGAKTWGNRNGGKFEARHVTENGVNGVRVWRVE